MRGALRTRESALLVTCVFLLMIAFAVMVVRTLSPSLGALRHEAGSLQAPAEDSLFAQTWGEPAGPPPVALPASGQGPSGGGSPEDPTEPRTPKPVPVPPDEPPSNDDGLLGLLPDLPILPPALRQAVDGPRMR